MTASPPPLRECLDEEQVVALLHGSLAADVREAVASHLGSCTSCRKLVADMALALSGPAPAGDDLAPLHAGSTLGRYVVIGPIGSGAMGLVYAAFDRELGRKVALKLLRPAALDSSSAELLGARLRREAQALAQLTHPNVVAVHEVDTFEGRIFLAMELVEGSTLGAWLREAPRGWRDVVSIFRQAGEGLAAAHAAGLVHRDFKPDNVLVGKDGRVRVTDFGLARAQGSALAASIPTAEQQRSANDRSDDGVTARLEDSLTTTGALVGTPAYMAPEQLRPPGRADALSDQFSFCVALFETLYGARPFPAGDRAALDQAIREGDIREPPRARRVPRWLYRIVLRGLHAEPAARWPSMRALLDALARGPRLTPVRVLVPTLALGAVALMLWSSRSICTGADAAWGTLWNAGDREAIHQAFQKTGRAEAEPAFATVASTLDAFRAAWISMHQEACVATHGRHEQSEALLDLRMVCLGNERLRAQALVRAFAEADAKLVENAPAALDALPSISACANATALLAPTPLPADPQKRARIAALEARFAEIAVRANLAGKGQGATADLTAALAEARQTGYLPLVARMLVEHSRLETANGFAGAHETAHEAAMVALEGRDDATLADAWNFALYTSTHSAEGHRMSRYAEAAIARLGSDDEREGTRLGYLVGLLIWRDKKFEEARPLALRGRELLVKSRGPDYWRIAFAEEMLGHIEFYTGRGEQALAAYQRSEKIRIKNFGPDAGRVGVSLCNEGTILYWLGRLDESVAAERKAIAIEARAVPEYHGNFYPHVQLALALRGEKKFADALAEDRLGEEMLARFKPLAEGDHDHCEPLMGEGADLLGLGRAGDAIGPLEQALRLCENDVDFYNPATTQLLLAQALWDSDGDKARARQLGRAAAEAFQIAAERSGSWFVKLHEDAAAWVAAHP